MPRVKNPTRTKVMQCRECGNDMTVGFNTQNAPRCAECGAAALEDNIRQMVARSGPSYDRWRAGMARALAK